MPASKLGQVLTENRVYLLDIICGCGAFRCVTRTCVLELRGQSNTCGAATRTTRHNAVLPLASSAKGLLRDARLRCSLLLMSLLKKSQLDFAEVTTGCCRSLSGCCVSLKTMSWKSQTGVVGVSDRCDGGFQWLLHGPRCGNSQEQTK